MSRHIRIGAIYRKELINILRDRRAMLAMIIIPVVMYPALMLGFGQARVALAHLRVADHHEFAPLAGDFECQLGQLHIPDK